MVLPTGFTDENRARSVKVAFLILLGTVSVAYHLWYTQTFGVELKQHKILHLGIMLVAAAVVAYEPGADSRRGRIGNVVTLVEGAVAAGAASYLFLEYERIVYHQLGIYTDTDLFVGFLFIALLLDLCRRIYGPTLSGVGVFGLLYALYGEYFPGILHHNGVKPLRLVQGLTVEFGSGVFGVITEVSATYIVIFMILAGLLESYGALEYFIQLGTIVGRRAKSGLAQMTTVASMGMGSVNGSAAANAATTGAFTIPLLKRHGMDEDTAASFEAVASSGGQIMPPIMGAAAFIMAQMTGTKYLTIITVGLLPALLFYGTVAVAVHFTTLKEGISETVEADSINDVTAESRKRDEVLETLFGRSTAGVSFERITLRNLVLEGLALWVPVAVLLYTLVILLYDPLYAGFWSIVSAVVAAFVQDVVIRDSVTTDGIVDDSVDFLVNTFDGFGRGLESAAPIAVSLGVMNVFVGVLNLTGFTQVFAQSLIELSGGILPLLLVFAMVAALLFGLGMPTVAAYITAVLLIAPALQEAGVQLLTAHFFVFYFAILSALTPPVAIACLVAAEVSGGNFWRTAKKSLVIGGPLFVLPYVFAVNDSLLYWNASTPATFLLLAVAFVAAAIALVGYLDGPIGLPVRFGLLAGALLSMFAPHFPASLTLRLVATVAIGGVIVRRGNLLPDRVTDLFDRPA